MNKNFITKMKKELEKELEESMSIVAGLEEVMKAPESKNEEDRADQLVVMQNAMAQKKIAEKKINLMKKAVFRINEGEFGVCVDCGEEIGEKRLMAISHAETCIECAENRETAGKLVA